MNSLSARDVYTGRVLWRRVFEDLCTAGIYYDGTYADTPLSTQYNQVTSRREREGHQLRRLRDAVYLVIEDRCEVLDPVTGRTRRTIMLPDSLNSEGSSDWTYLGVYENLLIAGVEFANAADAEEVIEAIDRPRKRGVAWSPKLFASQHIVVIDRESGQMLWKADARHSFIHNGLAAGGGKVFAIDKLPRRSSRSVLDAVWRRPTTTASPPLTRGPGELAWESKENVFGTWHGYSAEHNTLLHAGAAASDRSFDEVGSGVRAHDADTGDVRWENLGMEYAGPCIIHNDSLITNSRSYSETSGVFDIVTGEPRKILNPLSGDLVPWTYKRTYGCNTAVASEHLLTFRSGAAGYYDLDMKCGVANLGGFRSGCTSNLIVADGVLNAPDFTRTCSCGYQNQTSLALVHMPDADVWTVNAFSDAKQPGRVERLGLNFGAAGARRAVDGGLWIEYPSATDAEFPLEVELVGSDLRYERRHSSSQSGELPWVRASHVAGADSITIRVADSVAAVDAQDLYTVRLLFPEPVDQAAFEIERASESEIGWDTRTLVFRGVPVADGRIAIRRAATVETLVRIAGLEVEAE